MEHNYSDMSVAAIKSIIDGQTTFDGKLLPDMAESYKIRALVDELLRRAEAHENTTVCDC